MKTLKTIFLPIFILFVQLAFAQTKSETIKVSGNCGMCKSKIEKAAKEAGATYAAWNSESKLLLVKYNTATTNAVKIQENIANVGYDTQKFRATDEVYNKLHGCCKYERTSVSANEAKADNCCTGADCCNDKACCESKDSKTCCAEGKCSKEGGCCKDNNCKADCCKKS